MRLITSSVRSQLFAAFAAVIVVFGIGVVVSINSVSGLTSSLRTDTARVKMADTLSKDTYNMQGSQLMATLNNGASAKDHERDVKNFAGELTALKPHMTTAADRGAYAAIQQAFAKWQGLDRQAVASAQAHNRAKATALVTGAANDATDALSTDALQAGDAHLH